MGTMLSNQGNADGQLLYSATRALIEWEGHSMSPQHCRHAVMQAAVRMSTLPLRHHVEKALDTCAGPAALRRRKGVGVKRSKRESER